MPCGLLSFCWFQNSCLDAVIRSSIVDDTPYNMFSRTALSRGAQLATCRQASSKLAQRRGYAAVSSAPDTHTYETTDVGGVKIAARDSHGPTTKLAIVAKAGTRYQPAPGLTAGLEEFAFKARLNRIDETGHFRGYELIRDDGYRTPRDGPHFESPVRASFWEVNCSHTTPGRLLLSRQASCARTFLTSPSYWQRSSRKPSTPVCLIKPLAHIRTLNQ